MLLQVEHGHVQAMLEAANWAPTHGKTEPWRFVVFSGQGKDRMTNLTIEYVRVSPDLTEEQRGKKLLKFAKKQEQWAKVPYTDASTCSMLAQLNTADCYCTVYHLTEPLKMFPGKLHDCHCHEALRN